MITTLDFVQRQLQDLGTNPTLNNNHRKALKIALQCVTECNTLTSKMDDDGAINAAGLMFFADALYSTLMNKQRLGLRIARHVEREDGEEMPPKQTWTSQATWSRPSCQTVLSAVEQHLDL
jgi:hypothetical protein